MLRTVDLSTEVLAPVIVGAVMTSAGMAVGGLVIAGWNVGSLVVEYGLLHHLFHSNPDLQKGKGEVEGEVSVPGLMEGEWRRNKETEKIDRQTQAEKLAVR